MENKSIKIIKYHTRLKHKKSELLTHLSVLLQYKEISATFDKIVCEISSALMYPLLLYIF